VETDLRPSFPIVDGLSERNFNDPPKVIEKAGPQGMGEDDGKAHHRRKRPD